MAWYVDGKSVPGVWTLYRYVPASKEWEEVGSVNEYDDCWGDELYTWMEENVEGFQIKDYDVEGDSSMVAVMPKAEGLPEYKWEFHADKKGG